MPEFQYRWQFNAANMSEIATPRDVVAEVVDIKKGLFWEPNGGTLYIRTLYISAEGSIFGVDVLDDSLIFQVGDEKPPGHDRHERMFALVPVHGAVCPPETGRYIDRFHWRKTSWYVFEVDPESTRLAGYPSTRYPVLTR